MEIASFIFQAAGLLVTMLTLLWAWHKKQQGVLEKVKNDVRKEHATELAFAREQIKQLSDRLDGVENKIDAIKNDVSSVRETSSAIKSEVKGLANIINVVHQFIIDSIKPKK